MTVRHMTVVRAPGTMNKPSIRIANNLLAGAEFTIGTAIEVTYQRGIITITKINQQHGHNNISETNPVTDPTTNASGAVDATTGDGYTGPRASDSQRNQEAMRTIRPLRYVLRGHWHTVSAQDARTYSC